MAYDSNGDIFFVAIDNFFSDKAINDFRDFALTKGKGSPPWEAAFIHPSMVESKKHDKRKGNGFPGLRADIHRTHSPRIIKCLEPVMAIIDPKTNLHKMRDVQTLFGLLVPLDGDDGVLWLDSQRIPHNDVRWDIPTNSDGTVPVCYACVLPLTRDWNSSGTGIWVERGTGFSLLKTVSMNNQAQGNMNPHVDHRMHADLDLYKEIPDPLPQALYEHVWAKMSVLAELRFNRYVFYDGRRLHQQFVMMDDLKRLVKDPYEGRLTMNSFFWSGPKK